MASSLESFLAKGALKDAATPAPGATDETAATDVKTDELPGEKPVAAASAPSAEKVAEQAAPDPKAVKPEGEGAEKPAAMRDEQGKFAKKSEVSDEVLGLRAALQETRRENRDLKARQQQAAPKPPSFLDDPDKALDVRDATLRGELARQRYTLSEANAKQRHEDFDAVVLPFLAECEEDEALGIQVFHQCDGTEDPAEAFYRHAKARVALGTFDGNIDKFRGSIEEPLKAQVKDLTEKLAASEARFKNLSNLPESLNVESSSPPGAGATVPAKMSLDSIVAPRKKKRA